MPSHPLASTKRPPPASQKPSSPRRHSSPIRKRPSSPQSLRRRPSSPVSRIAADRRPSASTAERRPSGFPAQYELSSGGKFSVWNVRAQPSSDSEVIRQEPDRRRATALESRGGYLLLREGGWVKETVDGVGWVRCASVPASGVPTTATQPAGSPPRKKPHAPGSAPGSRTGSRVGSPRHKAPPPPLVPIRSGSLTKGPVRAGSSQRRPSKTPSPRRSSPPRKELTVRHPGDVEPVIPCAASVWSVSDPEPKQTQPPPPPSSEAVGGQPANGFRENSPSPPMPRPFPPASADAADRQDRLEQTLPTPVVSPVAEPLGATVSSSRRPPESLTRPLQLPHRPPVHSRRRPSTPPDPPMEAPPDPPTSPPPHPRPAARPPSRPPAPQPRRSASPRLSPARAPHHLRGTGAWGEIVVMTHDSGLVPNPTAVARVIEAVRQDLSQLSGRPPRLAQAELRRSTPLTVGFTLAGGAAAAAAGSRLRTAIRGGAEFAVLRRAWRDATGLDAPARPDAARSTVLVAPNAWRSLSVGSRVRRGPDAAETVRGEGSVIDCHHDQGYVTVCWDASSRQQDCRWGPGDAADATRGGICEVEPVTPTQIAEESDARHPCPAPLGPAEDTGGNRLLVIPQPQPDVAAGRQWQGSCAACLQRPPPAPPTAPAAAAGPVATPQPPAATAAPAAAPPVPAPTPAAPQPESPALQFPGQLLPAPGRDAAAARPVTAWPAGPGPAVRGVSIAVLECRGPEASVSCFLEASVDDGPSERSVEWKSGARPIDGVRLHVPVPSGSAFTASEKVLRLRLYGARRFLGGCSTNLSLLAGSSSPLLLAMDPTGESSLIRGADGQVLQLPPASECRSWLQVAVQLEHGEHMHGAPPPGRPVVNAATAPAPDTPLPAAVLLRRPPTSPVGGVFRSPASPTADVFSSGPRPDTRTRRRCPRVSPQRPPPGALKEGIRVRRARTPPAGSAPPVPVPAVPTGIDQTTWPSASPASTQRVLQSDWATAEGDLAQCAAGDSFSASSGLAERGLWAGSGGDSSSVVDFLVTRLGYDKESDRESVVDVALLLQRQHITTVGTLRLLSHEDLKQIGVPLGVIRRIEVALLTC
eukprot:TRINITY_DN13904_c0_g1_i1.p1 TRINITY_DN13904_c0_g1~~TRINITY_DN13904_c0_g1_i1.p1  ORF type:complete len:1096 (+),score=167.79 TRINITY_DN13904_c0_g1_i1:84-3371(+)